MEQKHDYNPNANPMGLYFDKESGRYIGCLDDNQASAAIRVGYKLFLEGREAAMMTEEQIAGLNGTPAPVEVQPETKKGK